MIERRARAPVFNSIAFAAIAFTASVVKRRRTPSIANSFEYCFTIAFFVFSKIFSRSAILSWSSTETTGKRPMNSGIMPNRIKSSGASAFIISSGCNVVSFCEVMAE